MAITALKIPAYVGTEKPSQLRTDLVQDMNDIQASNNDLEARQLVIEALDRFVWKGNYVAATIYAMSEAVNSLGSVYVSLADANQGNSPASSAASWDLLIQGTGGSGDMLAATYDPTAQAADAFAMDNMVEGTATKILTAGERAAIATNTDKVTYPTSAITKLAGIDSGAQANRALASQAEAEAGTDNVKGMTSLRVAQAIAALGGGGGGGGGLALTWAVVGAITTTATSITGTSGTSWNKAATSNESLTGEAHLQFTQAVGGSAMFGIGSDPLASTSYASIDHCFYLSASVVRIYENGISQGSFGAFTSTTVFGIDYVGTTVEYTVDGVIVHTTSAVTAGLQMFIDNSIASPVASYENIVFSGSVI